MHVKSQVLMAIMGIVCYIVTMRHVGNIRIQVWRLILSEGDFAVSINEKVIELGEA